MRLYFALILLPTFAAAQSPDPGRRPYETRCARCHGDKAQGDVGPVLVGGRGTLATPRPLKTVGSFWPYATTVWDYVNRAMPFDEPGVLKPADVYAVVAFILNINGIVPDGAVMDAKSLPKVQMPHRGEYKVPEPWKPGTRRGFSLQP